MNAIVSLLVAEREERLGRTEPAATELVLADSGLEYAAIAGLTGRGATRPSAGGRNISSF